MIRSLKIYEFLATIARKLDDNALSEVALNYCLLLHATIHVYQNPDQFISGCT